MQAQWPGNKTAAKKILEHFGIPYTERPHGTAVIFEGKKWGKILVLICGTNSRQIVIQMRSARSQKDSEYYDQGGIIINSCCVLVLTDRNDEFGEPEVAIRGTNGAVFINRQGIHATIK